MEKRQVGLATLLKLVTDKKPFGMLGLLFTMISLLILLPVTLFLSSSFAEPYEKYDYEEIIAMGIEKDAVILDIVSMDNVSVNGSHPRRITYTFTNDDTPISDAFQTFELDKVARIHAGDSVSVKVYNGQSVIADMEPFRFPYAVFYILPATFFMIGSILFMVALIPALPIFRLYKYGIVKDGTITSMVANGGLPVTGIGRKVMIDYYYTGNFGNRIYGNGTTADFSILGEKKTGDAIKIFVSPDNEDLSCLVPEKEAAKRGWTNRV